MDTFSILFGDNVVGKAQVSREGLYYLIRCRCELSGETVFRVQVRCKDQLVDLGILVPEDGGFALKTRIPVKRVGEGSLSFFAAPRHRTPETAFIPLYPEEPFRYLSRLRDAYLTKRSGQIGIIIKEPGCG